MHRELVREWLCEPKKSSLRYIQVLGGGSVTPLYLLISIQACYTHTYIYTYLYT